MQRETNHLKMFTNEKKQDLKNKHGVSIDVATITGKNYVVF